MVFFLSDNTLKQKQSLGLQEASCPDWKMTTQCGEIAIYSSGQGCGAVQAGLRMATFTTSPTNIRWKIFKFLFLQKKIKLWNIFRKHNCREGQLQNLLHKSQSHPQWDCPNWPLFFGRHRWGIKVHLAWSSRQYMTSAFTLACRNGKTRQPQTEILVNSRSKDELVSHSLFELCCGS